MNYDKAREVPGKGWHWTTMNDGIVRTAEPCSRHVGDESDPMWYMKPSNESDWQRCEPHATRDEAERHFYDWCLETVAETRMGDQQLRCRMPDCAEWTDTVLGNLQDERLFNGDPLCEAHRTREVLAQIRPFEPGMELIHS